MKNLMLLMLLCFSVSATAQKITISGQVTDSSTGESLPGAAAQLLNTKDSTQVAGGATNANGSFTISNAKAGNYLLKISYMGYQTHWQPLSLTKKNSSVNLGTIALGEDSKLMKEAEIVERVAQVEMKADTFVYNSAAFRLPEGSALEELIKKLPGAEIDDEGKIKINGKEVKKIMVDGKEFFLNDTKMALKNLPSKIVDRLKAYDRKSDYSRVTGIDDGEEETVLDLTVKKGMKEGWMVNVDGAYGTEDRYSGKLNISRFLDHFQMTLVGSSNNVNDQGFPGGGRGWGGWGGGGGVVKSQMAGINIAWENGKKENEAGLLKVGGNARFNHTNSEIITRTNSQTFLPDGSSTWGNSKSFSNQIRWNLNTDFRVEWAPDSMTNIIFRPSYSHSDNSGESESTSLTFNEDPYKYMKDPVEEYFINPELFDSITVNSNERRNRSHSFTNSANGDLQLNRRLGKPGRNITLNANGGYSKTENYSYSISDVLYPQSGRPRTFNNQFNENPSESYNIRGRLSYTEPLNKYLNLQASYQFQYRFSDSDRTMYSLDSLISKTGGYINEDVLYNMFYTMGLNPGDSPMLNGIDWRSMAKNWENSQYATYNEYNHDATILLRYTNTFENGQQLRFNAGASFQPQTTHMDYQKHKLDTIVTRHIFNWAPRVDVRWKISNTSQLRVRYNGSMSQPSMLNLLEVTDSSDPLNISTGNSGLTSSWNNRLNAFYNDYRPEEQMGWAINANYNQTSNSISTATIYDKTTGARYSRPMNIDGNWSAGSWMMFNTALDKNKKFSMNTNMYIGYNRNVGYLSTTASNLMVSNTSTGIVDMDKIFSQVELEKSTSNVTNLNQSLRFNYRDDIFEVGLNGSYNYQHARNDKQANANMDTWSFNYGGNLIINAPWGSSLSTDIGNQCRRGYNDESMNTNELIWNAQISHNFKKQIGQDLSISVQWYDILRERSNISRSISATMRSDTYTNAIHSYLMVHIIYKLNLLGNKEARSAMAQGPNPNAQAGQAGGARPRGEGGERGPRNGGNRGGGFGGPR